MGENPNASIMNNLSNLKNEQMKYGTLKVHERKRLKAILSWLLNSHYVEDLIYKNDALDDFDYEYFFEISEELIPEIYHWDEEVCGFERATELIIILIIRTNTYRSDLIPFLEFIDCEYQKFNTLNLSEEYSFDDDFWIDCKFDGKNCLADMFNSK
jgi:hypothetical protein